MKEFLKARPSLITLQELPKFRTKMMISIISDCFITMQVYGNFRFSVVQPFLLDLMLIIEKKNGY